MDDVPENRDLLARRLERLGLEAIRAESGEAALAVLEREAVDLVLLDVMMPGMDGFAVLDRIKTHEEWRHLPVLMISALDATDAVVRGIKLGADDYIAKPFDPVLLNARVAACLEKKRLRDHERRHLRAIEEAQAQLAAELSEAAAYVRSLLPGPLAGPLLADWQFLPSSRLGGDLFGYHWLDADRFAVFLIDVSGHGVGAALLSVSVTNALTSRSLVDVDFGDPGAVLAALNAAFPMERHNNMYFTGWYGVYTRSERSLRYASGGHPPALLVSHGSAGARTARLPAVGLVLGGMPDQRYEVASCPVPAGSLLYVFSDGIYEAATRAGVQLGLDAFEQIVQRVATETEDRTAGVLREVKAQLALGFDDDVSLLAIAFG